MNFEKFLPYPMLLGTGLGKDLGVFFIKIPKVTSAWSSLLHIPTRSCCPHIKTDDQVTEDTGTMHVVELQCDTNIFMDNFTLPVEEYGLAKQDDIDNSSFTELKNHGHGEDNIITLWHVNSDFEFEVSIEA